MHTLSQLLRLRAADAAERTFLRFGPDVLTFGALHDRVRAAASALRSRGVAPGQRAMLMMRNHPDHVVTYLALAWIDCTVIELSIHLKSSGIALQMEDAEPHAVIADPDFAGEVALAMETVEGRAPRLLVLSDGAQDGGPGAPLSLAACADASADPCERALDATHTISYTSGTTGRPKGVVMSERYFQVGARNAAILADVRDDDVLFLWEPFYHIAGWMTVVIALRRGVAIAMVERFSASTCLNALRTSGATLFHYLGGAMNLLLKQPERDDDADNPVRIAWGAAAPADSWKTFERRFGVTVREGYGISEAQNFTHLNLDGRVGSIGRPVAEFDAWIADADGSRLAPGKVGEIVVKPRDPRVVMSGYFRDPQRTAEVLRNGCVHTGDLGYMDADGYFYYSGRKKDSLRRRGENVSAWEVERVLNAHPAVEDSAVVGVPSRMGEQDIRAFVKPAGGAALDPLDLAKWCEARLAYYQVPRYIDVVADFPRGPTQRILKGELPSDLSGSWDLEASGYRMDRG